MTDGNTIIIPGRPPNIKATNEQLVAAYSELNSVWQVAARFGMCGQSVHERLAKLGATNRIRTFTDNDRARLIAEYEAHANAGTLDVLAEKMGRTKQFICRQARALGLTKRDRARPYIAEVSSENMRLWHAENEHPRGALGYRHTENTKKTLSKMSRAAWLQKTEEERAAVTMKQMKARVEKYGSIATPRPKATWKAGWREIGGQRKYYRSRWEANYARYLEWLKQRGEIADWAHEPETFWFENIKRGVRSYLPDFRVWENDGTSKLHEVKGWMDSRSKTTLKRMAKYYPHEQIILIKSKEYNTIEKKIGALIRDWEFKS